MRINEELNRAIKNQDLEMVKILVKKTDNINYVDKMEQTALMWACQTENKEIVDYLIKNGANINYKNNLKETALTQACDTGNNIIIKKLLEGDMVLDLKDSINDNYLNVAGEKIEKIYSAKENLKLVKESMWFKIQKQVRKELKQDIKELTSCDNEVELQKLVDNISQKRHLEYILKTEKIKFKALIIELKEQLHNTSELLNTVERFKTRINLDEKKVVFDTIDYVKSRM